MCLYYRVIVVQTWLLVFPAAFFLVVAGLVCFLARSTRPTLSQLVTSSQHFVKNTHCVLGTHCTDVIFTHQEFDSPQARCRTVRDSPFFLCTLHSRALAHHNADASGDPQIDCTRRGQFSTCCCSSGRSTKISRCAFRQRMIA